MTKLWIMAGPPGSGKTTFVNRRNDGVHVSRDKIRFSKLDSTDTYFAKEKEVYNEFIHQIQEAIDNKAPVIYADATHLSEKSREKLLNRLTLNDDVELGVFVFCADEDVCIARNNSRSGKAKVPESVIHNMVESFRDPYYDSKYHYHDIIYLDENGEEIII